MGYIEYTINNMKHKKLLLLLSLILSSTLLFSQEKQLLLEDIFKNNEYALRGIPQLKWLDDDISYSVLESNTELNAKDIVKYDVESGERTVLVSAKQLIPQGQDKALNIYNYFWSPDNTKLLIYTNTKRVWRLNSRGDYWVLDLTSNKLTQIAPEMDESRLMFAKFSPDASKVAFVYYNNIYVQDLVEQTVKQLTFDGSEEIINGNFDWVYEEELHIHDGFRWSPDGKSIAYWQFDTKGTGVFHMVDNLDSIYSQIISFPYPKIGTTNSAAKVGVLDIQTAKTRWFDIPGDPRNNYLARMDFIPNSNEVMIQQLNRLQNTNNVYIGDVTTMEFEKIYEDKDEAFLDVHDNITWLENEKYFTWTSEKDGWRHLYLVSRDGKKESLITKGEFDVISIKCIDEKSGYVYYIASPDSAVEEYLYRSKLNGKEKEAQRVTPKKLVGHNKYNINKGAKYAIHTFSNSQTPNQYELISLPRHRKIITLEDNNVLASKVDSLQLAEKEYFKVQAGEVELDGWMIKPPHFDPSRKYPVIFYIYGEPWSSTIQNIWSSRDLWYHYMANQGYIVMSIDPRGTNNPRGREWRKSIYGKIGIVPPADHAAATLQAQIDFPYIDAQRIGIWGWSGGGSSAAHAILKYPDVYQVAIAIAGVYSHYVYDTIYQERYMGLPSTNFEGLFEGSAVNFAANLKGDLLLIHGTADDNVHYQAFELMVDELIKHNKMFDQFSYPMRSHSVNERENTTYHLYQMMEKYWLEHLKAGPRE